MCTRSTPLTVRLCHDGKLEDRLENVEGVGVAEALATNFRRGNEDWEFVDEQVIRRTGKGKEWRRRILVYVVE